MGGSDGLSAAEGGGGRVTAAVDVVSGAVKTLSSNTTKRGKKKERTQHKDDGVDHAPS